jgi:hypothetical protein
MDNESSRQPPTLQRPLSAREGSEQLGYSAKTILRLVRDDPEVLRLPGSGGLGKRTYTSVRIPPSVVERLRLRLTAPASPPKVLKGLAKGREPRIIKLRDLR